MPYEDLRHYLRVLEEKGKLFRIAKEVDKDWELSAVAKLVFRKIPDERRPALLFENVKGFSIPVVTGVLGASRQVYAIALETELNFEEIFRRWSRAQANPVQPVVVQSGLCQEVVVQGDEVDLFKLPVPVWTVPHDPAPYFTAPYVIGKDPQTAYRLMLEVHTRGSSHVATLSKEQAELKQEQVHAAARAEGFPFRCVIEPA